MIDLHSHTTASHGQRTPAEAICEAERIHLEALAITDHNTIDGLAEASLAARTRDVMLVPGVELSVDYEGWEIHMLGLFLNHEDPGVRRAIQNVTDLWVERLRRMCEKLQDLGMDVPFEEFEYTGRFPVVVSCVAGVMVRHGYVETGQEAFDRYLNEGLPGYVPSLVSLEEGGRIVHDAGGLYIIAHPNYGGRFGDMEEDRVRHIQSLGADGIEAFTKDMPAELAKGYVEIARNNGMVVTGGTDCHGGHMGTLDIPDWAWTQLLERVRRS